MGIPFNVGLRSNAAPIRAGALIELAQAAIGTAVLLEDAKGVEQVMSESRVTGAGKLATSSSGLFDDPQYVWMFQCSTRLALHAATLDRKAGNLPRDVRQGGEWTLVGQLIVGPKNAPIRGIDIEALIAGIEKEGYYLWSADMEQLPDPSQLMR